MLTVQLHEELRGTNIKVNSVSPGFVKTDLTGYGLMTAEEGARLPVQYALGGGDDSGCFLQADSVTPLVSQAGSPLAQKRAALAASAFDAERRLMTHHHVE